jgi:DNA-binding response OmpR family regulator
MAKRILVIEDDPSIRTYLQKVLRQAGYDTLAARDGEEGLQMVRALLPDLVASVALLTALASTWISEVRGSQSLA